MHWFGSDMNNMWNRSRTLPVTSVIWFIVFFRLLICVITRNKIKFPLFSKFPEKSWYHKLWSEPFNSGRHVSLGLTIRGIIAWCIHLMLPRMPYNDRPCHSEYPIMIDLRWQLTDLLLIILDLSLYIVNTASPTGGIQPLKRNTC